MFFSEQQVNYLVSEFMPRVRSESRSAMIDVACDGMSILASAQKYGITHQSLSKNLLKLNDVRKKIEIASDLFEENIDLLPKSYLLKEIAHALWMADEPYIETKNFLSELCLSLGGEIKKAESVNGINFYLDGTETFIFKQDENYEREWYYDHNDTD